MDGPKTIVPTIPPEAPAPPARPSLADRPSRSMQLEREVEQEYRPQMLAGAEAQSRCRGRGGWQPRARLSAMRMPWNMPGSLPASAMAEAPAPQKRKLVRANVGQTLSSVNPALSAVVPQIGQAPASWPVISRTGDRPRRQIKSAGHVCPIWARATHQAIIPFRTA
jgi:hypothetical protein